MSQISSQAQTQEPNWVSIPFAKYSHNSSPIGTRNFIWNHVGLRNDLDFIVRDTRVIDETGNYANRIVMKITVGADILVRVTCKCAFSWSDLSPRKLRILES